MANYEIEWQAQVSGTTGTGIGQWVVYNGTSYIPATTANLASYPLVRGVIVSAVVNGIARVQFSGPLPASVHGLTYSASTPFVKLNASTGFAVLSSTLGTTDIRLGFIDASNMIHISIATGDAVFVLDATDFGYVGDGVTDDGPAIQAMLDASPRTAYLTSGDLILHIPATSAGGVIATPVTARWDTPGGFVGGFSLRGGNSTGTTPLTDTVLYVRVPTPTGGAGVSVTAITVGSSGYTYARLAGFPAGTFTAADVNARVEMAGCSNAALNGRGLICKYISATSVEVWCPSTVTNGTTVGTWRVLRSAFNFWTRDCEVSGFVFHPNGAGKQLRSIFDVTHPPGAGSAPVTGNRFASISCTPNGGATCDYIFEFGRAIAPSVGAPAYVDDGGGISKPYLPPNVDVMRVSCCTATSMTAVMQFESQARQSRQHIFGQNTASACASLIQCNPIYTPTLDGGLLWAGSVQFEDYDSAFSECTSYAYYLGIGQYATTIIANPQYEGAAGLLGFYSQVAGYDGSYVVRDGYHTIISDRVEPLSPFIMAPLGGPLGLDNVHLKVEVSPSVATNLIQLTQYSHVIANNCTFPNTGNAPPGLNGGNIYAWAASNTTAGWARITEIGCNEFYSSGVEWRPRATRIDELNLNPYATGYPYGGAGQPSFTGTTGLGTHLHGVKSFSTTVLPQVNTATYIATLKDLETSIAIDLPAQEYIGDGWVADLSVIATSAAPAAGSRNVVRQRAGTFWFAIDFAAAPGAGETITYAILLRRQATTATTQISFAQMQTLYALYDPAWYWDNNYDGLGNAWWRSIDGGETTAKQQIGLAATKPTRNTTDANFNNHATLTYTATKYMQATLGGVATGSWTIIIALKRAAGAGTTEIFQGADSVGVTSFSLYHSAATMKMTTTAGGAATLDSLIDVGTGPVLVCAVFDGAGSKIYPNQKTAVAGALGAAAMDSFVFGTYSGANGIIGEIAGISITNRAMGDSEVKSCMIAAALKLGITLGP